MEAAVSQTGAWPLVRLTRPRQWIKNLLVFAPLLFSASFLKPESDVKAFIGFVAFCVASSASYVLNDLMDVASDRLHPLKSVTRPIAAGLVSPFAAWVLFGVLVALTLCTFAFDTMTAISLILYLLLNVAYSARLKHVPVLDLFILSGGFVLRVYVGSTAIHVYLSFWMFITTLCLALYLAAGKRRQELVHLGVASRSVLARYTVGLLDYYALISSISAILFYGLFVATEKPALAVTLPFVLFGLFRYRYVIDIKNEGESPTDVFWTDPPLMLCIAGWAIACLYALLNVK
jgi:4-hydroxybenzoate polyprenyltransferase